MKIIDYIVLFLSLAVVLIVGFLSGRKSNKKSTSEEFLMAEKDINKLQAGFSMAATDFGGSGLVGAIGYCYICGMSGIWWNLAAAPAFLLVGLFLAKKFNRMDGATLPDYFGKRYSPAVKYISTVMHIFMNVAALAVQLTVSCTVLQVITGLNIIISLIISMVLVLLLTSGGLRAVINTDSTLFVIIVVSILLAVPIAFSASGGVTNLISNLPDSFMRLDQLGFWTPMSWILLCILGYSTNQNYIQRMVSAKDEGTATFGAIFTAGFYFVISIALGFIGIAATHLIPGIEDTNTVFPEMLVRLFPSGLTGLGLAAVFAATISTGTSLLHAMATLIVNDLWKPLLGKGKDDKDELLTSRITVIVAAIVSFGISLISSNVVDIVYIGGLFYATAVFVPMLFGMYGKFATSKAAFLSIIVTVVFSLCWEYIPQVRPAGFSSIPSNVFGLIVSTVVLILVSLIDQKKVKHT